MTIMLYTKPAANSFGEKYRVQNTTSGTASSNVVNQGNADNQFLADRKIVQAMKEFADKFLGRRHV